METLNIIEKIVSIVCPIISIVISIVAICKSNEAIKQVNEIKIGNTEKKQEANNNKNTTVRQSMK